MERPTRTYSQERRRLSGQLGVWRDVVIGALGPLIAWAVGLRPTDNTVANVLIFVVGPVVLYELGAYVRRYVWVVPKQIDESRLSKITGLQNERDEALRSVEDLRRRLSGRAEQAIAHEQRIQSLEAQLAGVARTAAERIGREDWQKLAVDFRNMAGFEVSAGWSKPSAGDESWRLQGGPEDCRECETMCRQAGTMLMKSPHVAEGLSGAVVSHTDPVWRWLEFVKIHSGGLTEMNYAMEQFENGEQRPLYFGRLDGVKAKSARACLDCATSEI